METKDYAYLSLLVLTAIFFYWHGYLAARCRARKSIAAIFNDSPSMREITPTESKDVPFRAGYRGICPGVSRRTRRIRAVFGIN
jgi:hypothetical protein